MSETDLELLEEYEQSKKEKRIEKIRKCKELSENEKNLKKSFKLLFGDKNMAEEEKEIEEEEKFSNAEKKMPEIMATFNMSQWELMRASNHFSLLEFYYVNIYQDNLKNWIMPYVAEAKNMYANIHAIGESKDLWNNIKILEKESKDFVRRARRRASVKDPEEILDMLDSVHFSLKRIPQQQGWRLMAEQRHSDEDDFAGL